MKFEMTLSLMNDKGAVLFHEELRSSDLTELIARLPLLVIRLRKELDAYEKPNGLTDDDIPF